MKLRRTRQAVAATAVVAAAVVGLNVPGGVAATTCTMTVSKSAVVTRTYATGVTWREYRVRVTRGSSTQTALVQLTTMPTGAKPRLMYKRLGWVDEIRDQVKAQFPRAVAAVNGGFFYEYRFATGGSAILPRDGSVASGQILRAGATTTSVVGVDTAGRPYVGSLGVSGKVTSKVGSYTLTGVNWHSIGDRGVVLYTPTWADSGARRPAGSVEWVLRADNTIAEVRIGATRGAPVAANTRVVAFGTRWADTARKARPGDSVSAAFKQVTSTGVTLAEAVGRGRQLVSGGTVALDCAVHSTEPRPRTTVGWTSKGRWMTLIVPGSGYDSSGYRIGGLSITAEANVAKALGFSSAVEVDGGGSVTSYLRTNSGVWDRVDDADSQWQRPVPNGLAFVVR